MNSEIGVRILAGEPSYLEGAAQGGQSGLNPEESERTAIRFRHPLPVLGNRLIGRTADSDSVNIGSSPISLAMFGEVAEWSKALLC